MLKVHQIELEMQNEELERAKLDTEDALAKYSNLFDFAPIGLFALDMHGLIKEVNLTGAKLLGSERSGLINRRFQLFVALEDRTPLKIFLNRCSTAPSRNGTNLVY